MDPASVDQAIFSYRAILFILAAANALGALGSFVSAFKGRPSVKKDEFDEHKSHVHARLNGLNDKLNTTAEKIEEQQGEMLKELREIAKVLGVHEGKLEGLAR